ncbi:MAG: hypothetical protein AAFY88_20650 [Acidobacteriota bacterium]
MAPSAAVTPQVLLERLDAIAGVLEARGDVIALLGLGSVGRELERLDEHSDLDFFVIVDPGAKERYLDSLDWLREIRPLAFSVRNTRDGHKALFDDGVFCEFAIFEPDELASIPFATGRLVWRRHDADEALARPRLELPAASSDEAWLLGEILTNLFVGLGREARGEKLAAMRLIQGYAVDHLLALVDLRGWPDGSEAELPGAEPPEAQRRDPFAAVRRAEARHPRLATHLEAWAGGYAVNRRAALSMLDFLVEHFEVPAAMANAIREKAGSR